MKKEVVEALALLRTAYPSWPAGPDTFVLYEKMLAGIPGERLKRAVLALVARNKYAPTIAEILAEAKPNPGPGGSFLLYGSKEWLEYHGHGDRKRLT